MTDLRSEIAGLIDKVPIGENTTARQFACEVGLWVNTITGNRPYRVDSAELVGFIYRRVMDPECWPGGFSGDGLADRIAEHFKLDEEN